jgi:acetolactate synthase-1/2/3 large subunit
MGLFLYIHTGACDGYARMRHAPALALLHLGPGLSNGLSNLHNARRAGSSVLVLVGEMASWHRHSGDYYEHPCLGITSLYMTSIVNIIS